MGCKDFRLAWYVCASLCVGACASPTVLHAALGSKGKLPWNAKFVSQSVLHRRYNADEVQAGLDSAKAACEASRWPHQVLRVVHTYGTLCKFYPPTFRHIADLLPPGAAPADDITPRSGTRPETADRSRSARPSSAPRSSSTAPLFSPVRYRLHVGRRGPRLRAVATVVGVALVSGCALSRRSKVQW